MKITRLRVIALAFIAAIMLFTGSNQASAAVNVGISVGGPPPPVVVERRWAPPYRGAVWIPGHQEWVNGRWVWIGGYYSYPPRRGGYWVPGRYRHHYYYPGHWAY
jgi:hypothetical protein